MMAMAVALSFVGGFGVGGVCTFFTIAWALQGKYTKAEMRR